MKYQPSHIAHGFVKKRGIVTNAKLHVGVNSIGLRRREYSNEKIREIQDVYRYLYQKGMNNHAAIEAIEAEMFASPERDEIILFVKNSKRGIMRGYFPE